MQYCSVFIKSSPKKLFIFSNWWASKLMFCNCTYFHLNVNNECLSVMYEARISCSSRRKCCFPGVKSDCLRKQCMLQSGEGTTQYTNIKYAHWDWGLKSVGFVTFAVTWRDVWVSTPTQSLTDYALIVQLSIYKPPCLGVTNGYVSLEQPRFSALCPGVHVNVPRET